MKIVFHNLYNDSDYSTDRAATEGRMESIMDILSQEKDYSIVSPMAAGIEDILRMHTEEHVNRIRQDEKLFRMALLSAGGAICAAEISLAAETAFACIRPPGHHASRDSCWGFCYFNNMGTALMKLRSEGRIKGAFVLDFDTHKGDGNIDVLSEYPGFKILNPVSPDRKAYLAEIEDHLHDFR